MLEKQHNSRHCFLCGRDNPVSLRMSWFNDPEAGQVRAELTVADCFCSYPGVVHGGIVAAILDETAGRAVMVEGGPDKLMVSVRLEVDFRKITPTETPLTVIGWVEQPGERRARVAAEIRLPDGTVSARCAGLLVRPPAEVIQRWEAEKPFWKVYDD